MLSSFRIHMQLLHLDVLLWQPHSFLNLFVQLVLPLHLEINQSIRIALRKPIQCSIESFLVLFEQLIEITLVIAGAINIVDDSYGSCFIEVIFRFGKLVG